MATEISPDGFSAVHNGARIYINPVTCFEDGVKEYRVQVYSDVSGHSQFHQTYLLGSLEDAQRCGVNHANLMAAAVGKSDAWYEGLRSTSAPDFEARVDAMEVHPDDFEIGA